MKIRPSAVIIENNKIMLLRYSYGNNDVFQFPGGNMEDTETLEETLARELIEELNLTTSIEKMLLSAQVINEKKNQSTLHCLFEGKILNNSKPIINPEETSALEVVWKEIEHLDHLNLYPSVGNQLIEILKMGSFANNYLGKIKQPWY